MITFKEGSYYAGLLTPPLARFLYKKREKRIYLRRLENFKKTSETSFRNMAYLSWNKVPSFHGSITQILIQCIKLQWILPILQCHLGSRNLVLVVRVQIIKLVLVVYPVTWFQSYTHHTLRPCFLILVSKETLWRWHHLASLHNFREISWGHHLGIPWCKEMYATATPLVYVLFCLRAI